MTPKATAWAVAILMFGSALPAAAQSPAVELAVGVQPLHVPNSWLTGFNVDVGIRRASGWGVGIEFGQVRRDEPLEARGSGKVSNLAAGPRWYRATHHVMPFVSLLAGAEFSSGDRIFQGARHTDSDVAFMLEPGVGVIVPIKDRWGVFMQGDGRYVFFKEEVDEQFRFVFGARFSFR